MPVIAISNQKGGVGKTTTAINLSAYLAKQGKNVLIVDVDPQANTTSGLGFEKSGFEKTIYNGLFDPETIQDIIQETPHSDKLALIPANQDLAGAELDLVNELKREFKLKDLLGRLDYDYVIIDTPPSLSLLTINALTAADYLLIPVQAEYYALEGLGQLLDTTERVKQALNPNLSLLGVLLTMANNRTTLSGEVHKEVRKHFKDKVFDVVIPRNVRLAEAPSHGRPISHHDKWSKGARSYKQLAKEVERRLSKKK